MIHAARDEYGDFTDAERFIVKSRALGNAVRFVPVPNAPLAVPRAALTAVGRVAWAAESAVGPARSERG
jgi:hypothetical protein